METKFILGLDIGTSSLRAAVFDEQMRKRPGLSVKLPHTPDTAPDGGSAFDADLVFEDLITVIDRVCAKAANKNLEIDAVGSCAFWHGIVGVDERGRATTPLLTWADRQSREYTPLLKEQFIEREVHNRTGAHFHSSFWPATLVWFRREQPDVWQRTARWMSFGDLVAMRIFGEAVTSISMASATGIFDQRKCDWDGELMRYLKIKRASLSRIASDGETFRLNKKYARRWPALAKAKWFPAIGDGAANNIGSGCVTKDRAAVMIGTSAAVRVVFESDVPKKIPLGLWCYRIDGKRVIVGGALSDGGGLYDRLKRDLRTTLVSDTAIGNEMARRGADFHGLSFLPFFAGERSTGYNEFASGSIHGLTMSHDAIDILQAAMESIAYRLFEILKRLETIGPFREIVTSGGALASSRVWTQIIADVLGRDLKVANDHEASLRGAVLLALETTGKIYLTDGAVLPEHNTIAFHPKCHEIYKKARKRHESVYANSQKNK